ncbi:MAG: MotA/TolQ/ExbB proton channel family protein [Methylococcaceae bacterium]
MSSITPSHVVEITLGLLILFSVVTWGIIFLKVFEQWRSQKANRHYSEAFWNAANLVAASRLTQHEGPLARIARSGFTTLDDDSAEHRSRLQTSGDKRDIMERNLRQSIQQERHRIEQGLTILASIGSTAPFIGLFGTVWGIMHALQDISKSGSAGLDVVAGPIGEALVATAIGIATAIPAVLAYNFLLRGVKLYESELEEFANDLLNLAMKAGFVLKQED